MEETQRENNKMFDVVETYYLQFNGIMRLPWMSIIKLK